MSAQKVIGHAFYALLVVSGFLILMLSMTDLVFTSRIVDVLVPVVVLVANFYMFVRMRSSGFRAVIQIGILLACIGPFLYICGEFSAALFSNSLPPEIQATEAGLCWEERLSETMIDGRRIALGWCAIPAPSSGHLIVRNILSVAPFLSTILVEAQASWSTELKDALRKSSSGEMALDVPSQHLHIVSQIRPPNLRPPKVLLLSLWLIHTHEAKRQLKAVLDAACSVCSLWSGSALTRPNGTLVMALGWHEIPSDQLARTIADRLNATGWQVQIVTKDAWRQRLKLSEEQGGRGYCISAVRKLGSGQWPPGYRAVFDLYSGPPGPYSVKVTISSPGPDGEPCVELL